MLESEQAKCVSYRIFYVREEGTNVGKSLSGRAIFFGNHMLSAQDSTYSKCDLRTNSIGIIWELGRNTSSWTPSQIY